MGTGDGGTSVAVGSGGIGVGTGLTRRVAETAGADCVGEGSGLGKTDGGSLVPAEPIGAGPAAGRLGKISLGRDSGVGTGVKSGVGAVLAQPASRISRSNPQASGR